MTLDDSSLETEPKFGHGEGNSGIWQLNSEFKSISYDGEAVNQPYNAALMQGSPCASTFSRTQDAFISNYQIISYLQNNYFVFTKYYFVLSK